MKDPKVIEREEKLLELTSAFCREHLNEEYEYLCEILIKKLARKRTVPFISGRIEIWSAAIIHALGRINFLYDKSNEPYITFDTINNYFGTSKSTVGQKATLIEEIAKLNYFDPEFSLISVLEKSPFNDLVLVNGFIVHKKDLNNEDRKEPVLKNVLEKTEKISNQSTGKERKRNYN